MRLSRTTQYPFLDSLCITLMMLAPCLSLDAQISQQPSSAEPEVRRALPVPAYDAPPSVPNSSPSPTPVIIMRAIPVSTPVMKPVVENHPVPPRLPTPVPNPTPLTQESLISSASTNPTVAATPFVPFKSSDPEGSIRIGPSASNDQTAVIAGQLQLAEGLFSHKKAEEAVPEYEKFLAMSSKGTAGRERALYHLAESQRLMGSNPAAETTLQRLIDENPSGEFNAVAQLRLGELNEADGNLVSAADFFAQAAAGIKVPSIEKTARWKEVLCREKSGQKDQARLLFEGIANSTEENSYKNPALLHLAATSLDAGEKQQALAWYTRILASKCSPSEYSEAAVKSALIQNDLGNQEEAKKLFLKVMASKDAGVWQSVAALGALRLASQSGDEATVIKVAGTALAGDSGNKPEILLLQANALRKLGKNKQALEVYDTILREFPGSKSAALAPFQRLLSLHAMRADSLPSEIDQYLLSASDPADRARAQLLKAEATLRKGKFREAAAFYHQVDTAALPPASQADILYKEAWALTQSEDKVGAIAALTRFLENYPNDDKAATALAQRALLRQQQQDIPGSLADFSLLEKQYPKASERELALQQKALLLGQQQDNKGMVGAFTLLLNDFPKSSAAPQAHYWIGWNAMENKDYATAVTELGKARQGDPKQFGERAGLRILLAEYYLNQPPDVMREALALPPAMIPPEVGRWLGTKALESGDANKAERFLSPLVKEGLPGASDSEIQAALASALIAQGKFREAQTPSSACLKLARDPASRAQALLVSASIQRSMNNIQQASSLIDEALLLQPEGPINADARLQSGDLLYGRHDYSGAAKAYITVAVLSDDAVQTPKALTKAIDAYRRSGNLAEAEKTITELKKRYPNTPAPPAPKS